MAGKRNTLDKRITTRFTPEVSKAIEAWGKAHGARSFSEALRMAAMYAVTKPADRGFAAAYQQNLAELREITHNAFVDAVNTVEARIRRR